MLAFFKRSSKSRNNDKHSAKKQHTNDPQRTAERLAQPPSVVVAQQNREDVDRLAYQYKSTAAETSTTAAGYHNQREIVVGYKQRRRDADNLVGSYRPLAVPHQSEHETVGERRCAGNLFTAVSATANASPSTVERSASATGKPTSTTSPSHDHKSASQAASPPTSHSKFGGFLGEIMAKGRNRRHNQSVKKNKQLQTQTEKQQPQPIAIIDTSSAFDGANKTDINTPDITRRAIAPVTTSSHEHLHTDIIYADENYDGFAKTAQPAQTPSYDLDPPPPPTTATFKNSSNQVEFIDDDARQSDDAVPNADDGDAVDDQRRGGNSTTDRSVLVTVGPQFVINSCNAPINEIAQSNTATAFGSQSPSINGPDQRERIQSELDSHTVVVERNRLLSNHKSTDDPRHNSRQTDTNTAVNSSGTVKNSPPYDHHNALSTSSANAVADNPSGVASHRELCVPSELQSTQTLIELQLPFNRTHQEQLPIETLHFRAPLAAVSDDDDDSDEPQQGTSIELDLISDCAVADVTLQIIMGQQPTKPTTGGGGGDGPNSPILQRTPDLRSPSSDAQTISPSFSPAFSKPPSAPSSLDERDIFYEANDNKDFLTHSTNLITQCSELSASVDTLTVNTHRHDDGKIVAATTFDNCTEIRQVANINNDDRVADGVVVVPSDRLFSLVANAVHKNQIVGENEEDDVEQQTPRNDDQLVADNDDESDSDARDYDQDDADDVLLPTVIIINDDNAQLVHNGSSKSPSSQDTDNEAYEEEDDYDYCDQDNGQNKRADSADVDGDSDDPENDSPDSGIDVLADMANVANLASAGSAEANNRQQVLLVNSATNNLLTSGGEHLVRSTSSGLESDLSDDQLVVDPPSPQGQHNSRGGGTSAFSNEATDDTVFQTLPHKHHASPNSAGSGAPRPVRSGDLNHGNAGAADDSVLISLPDIVESTSATSPTLTVGSGQHTAHSATMVSTGNQHIGEHGGRDSNCSASSSDSEASDYDKESNQEIMHEKM